MSDQETRREAFERKRAERNKAHQQAAENQELEDLEMIFELEEEHGVSKVAKVKLPYTAGLPCYVAVRCPNPTEMKRYRAMATAEKRGGGADPEAPTRAAHAVATACLIYPDPDVYSQLKEDRPGVHALVGAAAIKLALGEIEEEGKD